MKAGNRIALVRMGTDEPCPVEPGTLGTVTHVSRHDFGGGDRWTQIDVQWDNGRSLMVCTPPDTVRVVEVSS